MAITVPSGVPVGKGLTSAQWVTWFQAVAKDNPRLPAYTAKGAVTKTGVSITGDTWDQVYAALYSAAQAVSPPQTPDQVAKDTIALMEIQAVASGIGSTVTFTGAFATESVKAVTAGAAAVGSAIPGLSVLGSVQDAIATLGGFLRGLTSASLWIRVVKVIAGGVILTVGLVKMTGFDQKAGGVAAKAVKLAPLL